MANVIEQLNLDQKQFKDLTRKWKKLKPSAKFEVPIFPFELKTGFVDITNNGVVSGGDINSYQQFQRVFSGNETPIAVWKNSLTLDIITVNNEKKLKKNFKVGDHFIGISYEFSLEGVIDAFSGAEDFNAEIDKETINLLVPNFRVSERDLYNFYLIPNRTQRWMRITNSVVMFDPNGEVVGSMITLENVHTELFDSGASVYQTLLTGAIGGSYAWPTIIDGEVGFSIKETIGVNNLQIHYLGDAAIAGMGAYGRVKDKNYINEQQLLLPLRLLPPINTPITKNAPPTTDYRALGNIKPTLRTYLSDWKEEWKQSYNKELLNRWEGLLECENVNNPMSDAEVILENKAFSGFRAITYNHRNSLFYDNDIILNNATPSQMLLLGLICYLDIPIIPMESIHTKTYTASSVPIIGGLLNKLTFGIPVGKTINKTTLKYDMGVNILMASASYDLNLLARYVVDPAKRLGYIPLQTFDSSDATPISKTYGGASLSHNIRVVLTNLATKSAGITQATKTYSVVNQSPSIREAYIEVESDRHVENVLSHSDIQRGMGINFPVIVTKVEGNKIYFTYKDAIAPAPSVLTIDISYTYIADSDLLDTKDLGITWKWDATTRAIPTSDVFEIDNIIHHALAKCTTIISAYNDNDSIFNGRYETMGKFKDNVRIWSNMLMTSPYYTYPVDINELGWRDIKTNFVDVTVDQNLTFEYNKSTPIKVLITMTSNQWRSIKWIILNFTGNDTIPVKARIHLDHPTNYTAYVYREVSTNERWDVDFRVADLKEANGIVSFTVDITTLYTKDVVNNPFDRVSVSEILKNIEFN